MLFFHKLRTKLFFRIWLALIIAVLLVGSLYAWIIYSPREQMPREITIKDAQGVVIAHGYIRKKLSQNDDQSSIQESTSLDPKLISSQRRGENTINEDDEATRQSNGSNQTFKSRLNAESNISYGQYGQGPEFIVKTENGALMHIYLQPGLNKFRWYQRRYGWLLLLVLIGISASVATFPIIKRLTRRLENLQAGVESWGSGQISARIKVEGHDEIAFLADKFNYAADQIEALILSHKSMLAYASHELRTPLTRIAMALELMGETTPANLRLEMQRNLNELDLLIDEILTASRLESPQAEFGPLEVVDITGLAVEECLHHDAELDLGSNPQSFLTRGNSGLIRRVLRNLLNNARDHAKNIESSHAESQISKPLVQVGAFQEDSKEFIRLAVLDRGPGVAVEEQKRIFEPFYRTKRTLTSSSSNDSGQHSHTKSSGAGLGLSLVKNIVERHHGRVWHEPREGGGSVFVVLLLALTDQSAML
jgi:signal transduction histidine kinase